MQLCNTSGPSSMRSPLWKVHTLHLLCVGILAGVCSSFLLLFASVPHTFWKNFLLSELTSAHCYNFTVDGVWEYVCARVFRESERLSVQKWGNYFSDTGRWDWTGEGCPAVALFAGLADKPTHPSEYWTKVFCVCICMNRGSVSIVHLVHDLGSYVRNTSWQSQTSHHTKKLLCS